MQNTHQLNLNMNKKKEFHFWIPKYILKTINYIPKYLERKQTAKPFLTATQSIQNGQKTASHIAKRFE